jgi:putative hemolysin
MLPYVYFVLALLLLVGCGGNTALVTPTPTPIPQPTLPPAQAQAAQAREQLLTYIRQSANECVPPDGVTWQLKNETTPPPTGYNVYRFTAEGCEVTVSTQATSDNTPPPFFHVALGDPTSGFCWQAVVDQNGQIIRTGQDAANHPGLGNPAALYCEQQGYRYEIIPSEDDATQACGQCIFSDAPGHACNAWEYFHGSCQP